MKSMLLKQDSYIWKSSYAPRIASTPYVKNNEFCVYFKLNKDDQTLRFNINII